mgnify:CR=1 FL=1
MTEVLIALGSNLGERRRMLASAIERLRPAVAVSARSCVYETAPMYVTDQPAFLNMAVRGLTTFSPDELLRRLKSIEEELGREPTVRYGPRAIDLDILYYGERVVESDHLTIPHPGIAARAFVLAPLMDIAPDWPDPVHGQKVRVLHARVAGLESVQKAEPAEL